MFYFVPGINPRILVISELLHHGVRILMHLDLLIEGKITRFSSIRCTTEHKLCFVDNFVSVGGSKVVGFQIGKHALAIINTSATFHSRPFIGIL